MQRRQAAPGVITVGELDLAEALFLAGGDSDYVTDAHRVRIPKLFPQSQIVRFTEVGHCALRGARAGVDAVAALDERVAGQE